MRSPIEFAALRRDCQRIATRHFRTQFRLNSAAGARLGMAVSRRVSKHAVVRNRIRRIVRESFRVHRGAFPSCDVLLIAQASAAALNGADLRADLESIWARLAALKAAHSATTIATNC